MAMESSDFEFALPLDFDHENYAPDAILIF
jgi:hypothetical protein